MISAAKIYPEIRRGRVAVQQQRRLRLASSRSRRTRPQPESSGSGQTDAPPSSPVSNMSQKM